MTGRDAMAGPALGTTPTTDGRARNSKVRRASAMSKPFGEKAKATAPVGWGGAVHSAREALTTLRVGFGG